MARPSSIPALNLSDGEIARAGHLLTEFLRGLETSLSTRPVLPRLDRAVLSQLLGEDFPETGIGVDRLFDEIFPRARVRAANSQRAMDAFQSGVKSWTNQTVLPRGVYWSCAEA